MRYYFHLRIGQELSPDDLGMELPDLDSAYLEAFQAAQDMWGELLAQRIAFRRRKRANALQLANEQLDRSSRETRPLMHSTFGVRVHG